MNKSIILFFCLSVFYSTVAQNPIAEYYNGPEGYPAWTDKIHWDNVIDMSVYDNGSTDFIRFESARDLLYEQGGGVLYYPEGIYDFSDADLNGPDERGLMLRKGVVILGEKPDIDADGSDGTLELKTVFKFKFNKMGDEGSKGDVPANWNIIGIKPYFGEELKEVDLVGIAWVHVMGASVYFGPQMTWGETYETAGAWQSNKVFDDWKGRKPDGTYPLDPFCGAPMNTSVYEGAGNGRFVFGCKFEDAGLPNNIYDSGFGAGGFFVEKFISRIGIYGSNVFVANNVLPKATKNFDYHQLTSEGNKRIIYDYGFSMGIDINKSYCNINSNKWNQKTGGYWGEGVIVRDNWVYNHGNKGFEISGTWVTIQNNTNERDFLNPGESIYGIEEGWSLTINGYKTHQDNGSGDGFLNRAFDLAGKALWVDNNQFNRTGTPSPSNDGEGILCQLHGGTWILSWAITNNLGFDCQGNGNGYIAGWDVDNQGCLIAWNTTPNVVGHMKGDGNDLIDAAFVDNSASDVRADAEGISDVITTCPVFNPQAPNDVTVQASEENSNVTITWTDASSSEIGFRVDRKRLQDTSWTTIAYRPRHSVGHENNEQKWIDFLAPRGKGLQYRVVAVNCDDNDIGAAEAQNIVAIPGWLQPPEFVTEAGTFNDSLMVEIENTPVSADIFYTLDGSLPDTSSIKYTEPFLIKTTSTIHAIAAKPYHYNSEAVEITYNINQTTTTEPANIHKIAVYPNPARNKIYISAGEQLTKKQNGEIFIVITDITGRVIYQEKALEKTIENYVIDIEDYPVGEYMLHLRSNDQTKIIKIIKPSR